MGSHWRARLHPYRKKARLQPGYRAGLEGMNYPVRHPCRHLVLSPPPPPAGRGVKRAPPPRAEAPQPLPPLVAPLIGRAELQRPLRVDTASPEDEPLAVLLLHHRGVHALGRGLHGVQYVHTRIDEVIEKGDGAAAAVVEGLPACVGVDPVVELLVEGLVQLTVHLWRYEGAPLGAEVGSADKYGVDLVTDGLPVELQVLQRDLALELEDRPDVLGVRGVGHVP